MSSLHTRDLSIPSTNNNNNCVTPDVCREALWNVPFARFGVTYGLESPYALNH